MVLVHQHVFQLHFGYIFFVKMIFEVMFNYPMYVLWTNHNPAFVIIYLVGFSKGYWCNFLTVLNIPWSSFTLSSSCRISSIRSSFILLTFFVMFFRILFFFRLNSIVFSMSVVFLILTRSCFCSSDIWCNWSSDFSLLQLGSLKPNLSFADSVMAFLMWGNVTELFSSRADSFSVRVCWYNYFVNGSLSFLVLNLEVQSCLGFFWYNLLHWTWKRVTRILWSLLVSVPEYDRASVMLCIWFLPMII